MKITSIRAHNLMLQRAFVADVNSRVLLIAGPNGSGKTALIEGIRHVLTGDLPRGMSYKKDLPDLITHGEKAGNVELHIDDGAGRDYVISVNLKDGKHSMTPPLDGNKAFILSPQLFMEMDAAKRKKVVYGLAGISLKSADVVKNLTEAGHAEERVARIVTALGGGFDAAAARAKELVSEARGSWQVVTGEKYGSDKAKSWKADAPVVEGAGDPTKIAKQLAEKREEVTRLSQTRAQVEQDEAAHARSDDLRRDAAALTAAESDLATHEEKITEATAKVESLAVDVSKSGGWTAACPCCKKILHSARTGELTEHDPSKTPSPEKSAAQRAAQAALDALLVDRTKKRAACDRARAAKLALERLPERPTKGDLNEAVRAAQEAIEEQRLLETELADAETARDASAIAIRKTDDARRHHEDVDAFEKLAAAVSDMPAQYLEKALGKINDALARVSSAYGRPVQLDEGMDLRYGAVRYQLASRSQQWRMELALGLALAKGTGVVLMDEFDLVQPADRGAILQMLAAQEDAQVIVGATLKAAPVFPEGFDIQPVWLGAREAGGES